jgi:imidazolonepropionase-like amidohydrolase
MSSKKLALVGGTLIDGNGGPPLANAAVIVGDKRILAITRSASEIPSDAERLDVRGTFVIPGLMDANVHLVLDYFPLTLVRYEDRYDELAIEAAQIALKYGVTTVFDTWGPRRYLIKARERIERGEALASRVFLAGNIVGFGGPLSDDFFSQGRASLFDEYTDRINAIWQEGVGPELMGWPPERVRAAVREHTQNGIDFVKLGVTGHKASTGLYIQFSPRVQRAIVEEAHRAGMIAQTHTTSVEGLVLALDAGVDLLQHGNVTGPEPVPEETLTRLTDLRTPCALLAHTEKAVAWYRDHARSAAGNRAHYLMHEVADRNDRVIIRSGAVVLLSTDGGIFSSNTLNSAAWKSGVPPDQSLFLLGEGHFNWLLAVEQKGMKPMDALMAATRNIARAYKVDDRLGTLQAGKLADLVVLDANPLEAAANYRKIRMVMKEGGIVDRQQLPTARLLTADAGS